MFPGGPDGRGEREGSLHREQRFEYVDVNPSNHMLMVRAIESRIDVDGRQRRLVLLPYTALARSCQTSSFRT